MKNHNGEFFAWHEDEESVPISNGQYGQHFTKHTTPARVPCKRAAPAGMTPRKRHSEHEIVRPAAHKHFVQREKKHGMAQVGGN